MALRFRKPAAFLGGAVLLLFLPALCAAAERARLLYTYDEIATSLVINDFKFLTPKHGVAIGFIFDRKSKVKPKTLITDDGGLHWKLNPAKEVGVCIFFLNESQGWMATPKDIWETADGGNNWKKISGIDDVQRLFFLDAHRGWAAADKKKVFETADGGKIWTPLAAADKPGSNPDLTTYNWIDFGTPKMGIIAGWNHPPEKITGLPEWMNPDRPRFEREVPRVTIFLETRDGGQTWDSTTGSLFGHVSRVRLSPAGFGLGLIEFTNAFEWPSEVFRIDWTTGKSERVFRERNRLITDLALPPTGPAYLAGIEKLDRLSDSPIPGKLKIYKSDNLDVWSEMDVDYRATAHRAMLSALDDRNIWIATDTGMILKLLENR